MKNLRKIYAILLFLCAFVMPMILRFASSGAHLSGDDFVKNRAYIQNWEELSNHFFSNLSDNLLFISNPIFIFFIVAYLVQVTMKWTVSDD